VSLAPRESAAVRNLNRNPRRWRSLPRVARGG
jgi:hypothetical protein